MGLVEFKVLDPITPPAFMDLWLYRDYFDMVDDVRCPIRLFSECDVGFSLVFSLADMYAELAPVTAAARYA